VFLSYASQDAPEAQRICEALRAARIEVWFDKSELRGGDARDRSIRQQIHDCALFVPIICEWLDRAWSNRDPGIIYLLFDPFILRPRTIRASRRYVARPGYQCPGRQRR
jgi:TIR domain